MLSEFEDNSPKKNMTGKSLSELIEHYPHLIKTCLSYFLSLVIKNNDIDLLDYLFSIRTLDNTKAFDEFFLQCVQLRKSEMISLSLQNGQNINIQNLIGETALHIAANNGDHETIQFLQSYGADKYIKNQKGLTPYDYAIEQGNKIAIKLLFSYKSYSLEFNESSNQLSNRQCYTSKKYDIPFNQMYLNKLLLENMKKNCKMDHLLSQQTDDYAPEIILNNSESLSKITIEDEFPIEYMKTNINAISNHRYCNENIDQTNDEIIDINKYTGLPRDIYSHNKNINNKEDDALLFNLQTEQFGESESKVKYQNQITETYNRKTSKKDLKKTITLDLDNNDMLKSGYDIQLGKEQISGSSYIITQKISQTSNDKKSTANESISNNNHSSQSCGDVYMFLSEIQLEEYTELLIKNGFDDIKLIIDQTKKSIAMTDKNLYDAGIRIAGDRAKILIHLEERADLYNFDFNKKNVYYKPNLLANSMYRSDRHIQKVFSILSTIKMEKYLINFLISGYLTIDLILMQMLSRQPITEYTLENEIQIDKIGYRARLLTKFKEEAQNYITRGTNKNILIDSQNNSSEFCNCVIY